MVKEEKNFSVKVDSEIGELEAVIVHSLGSEVENMTPENAERALYSDILNLDVAREDYDQLIGVLQKTSKVFEVKDLLENVLHKDIVRNDLIEKVCANRTNTGLRYYLSSLNNKELARQLIEGVILDRDNLTRFLSQQRFAVRPLHNFFFTRDASVSIYNQVLVSKMASRVRDREAQIMEAIFDYSPLFNTTTFNANNSILSDKVSIEGGDVLIGRDDLLVIGVSARTTSQGVDYIIERFKEEKKEKQHIIVQELPNDRESFIHLDMVFTFLNNDEVMVYEPVIMQPNRFRTIHILIENGKVRISEEKNILEVLNKIGMNVKPIYCGGIANLWTQEREQWHSGANFFAIAPGKVIGYGRNVYTIEEMNKNGYEILSAKDVITGKVNLKDHQKAVVTIEGSELSRGGGGARCMTMPVRRKEVSW